MVIFLIIFTFFDLLVSFVYLHAPPVKGWAKYPVYLTIIPIKFLTLINIIFLTGMILIFVLFIVVGLSLNAEYFSPFVAPIFTLLVYFLKNWTFSVEAKCLELKTLIIKVCKKKAPPKEDEKCFTKLTFQDNIELNTFPPNTSSGESSNKEHGASAIKSNENTTNDGYREDEQSSTSFQCHEKHKGGVTETSTDTNRPSTSGNGDNAEKTNINESGKESCMIFIEHNTRRESGDPCLQSCGEHGETIISKELYEKVRKEILPLDHMLFYFFRRVIFVGLYAFVMFTVLILGRESGISGSVQVISGIAGALIPFLFYTNFADSSLSEKMSRIMATKEKLEHILKVKKRENNTIYVEFINIKNDDQRRQSHIGKNCC